MLNHPRRIQFSEYVIRQPKSLYLWIIDVENLFIFEGQVNPIICKLAGSSLTFCAIIFKQIDDYFMNKSKLLVQKQ